MNFKIYDHGEHINTIYGSESFVSKWCEEHGYTYELEVPPEPEQPEPTVEDALLEMTVDHEYRITLLELGVTNDAI